MKKDEDRKMKQSRVISFFGRADEGVFLFLGNYFQRRKVKWKNAREKMNGKLDNAHDDS